MRNQILLAVGIALANLLLPAVARADCQPVRSVEEALATAHIAFVGTVVAAAGGGPRATFSVEEIWVGDLPAAVEIRGTGDAAFMEDDRRWTPGSRYLVVPYVYGAFLRDHICSATTEWREELAALRPEDARAPGESPSASEEGIPAEVLAVAAGLGVLLMVGFVAFRQGSPSGGPRRTGDPAE